MRRVRLSDLSFDNKPEDFKIGIRVRIYLNYGVLVDRTIRVREGEVVNNLVRRLNEYGPEDECLQLEVKRRGRATKRGLSLEKVDPSYKGNYCYEDIGLVETLN